MSLREPKPTAVTTGQVVVGPGQYRKVILDDVSITGEAGAFAMVGTDSRVRVTGETFLACAEEFWTELFALAVGMERGYVPTFTSKQAELEEYRAAMTARVMAVITAAPTDGAGVPLNIWFAEGGCPPEVRPIVKPLCDPPPF